MCFIFNIFDLSNISFNNISFYHITYLLKSAGSGTNSSTSNLSALFFKLLKLLATLFGSSISYLSTSDLKLTKSVFLAKFDISIPIAFFKCTFFV